VATVGAPNSLLVVGVLVLLAVVGLLVTLLAGFEIHITSG
jgi:hypothetical protein